MNKVQKNKQYLFRKLRNFLQEHFGLFENDGLVQTVVADFNNKVEHIEVLMQKEENYNRPSSGIRDEERNLFNNVIATLAGIILTLAMRKNDRDTANVASLGLRQLMRSSLQAAMAQARAILELANVYRADIEAEPATKKALEDAEALAKEFSDRMLSPMERVDRRRENLRRLNEEQDALMDFVRKQLDQILRLYLISHPEFFAHYQSIRTIPNINGGGKRKEEEEDGMAEGTADNSGTSSNGTNKAATVSAAKAVPSKALSVEKDEPAKAKTVAKSGTKGEAA